jgi:hypothetical protein
VSRELVFTSAPRGIRPGSQGFCTVAYTQGMPAQLMQSLESLSGYRQIFSPQDSKASQNPVVFSHLVISLAGRRCHVLSRICDAGLDYTQRTNKFAHHVVLDPAEVPAAGPGWLLSQPQFMRREWAGEPTVLPTGPVVPSGDSTPRVCRAWQQVAGDAGWGGVLAETAARPNGRPAVLVFPPGMDVLPLLDESLALLPPQLRWQVSFSTYFTKLPAGIACQWRCVADGTPEAAAARRAPQASLLIDLCRPLGRAAGGANVEEARSGKKPSVAPVAEQLSDIELALALGDDNGPPLPTDIDLTLPLGVLPPAGGVVPPPISSQLQRPPQVPPLKPKRKRRALWPWLLAIAAAVVLVVSAGVFLWTVRVATNKGAEIAKNTNSPAVGASGPTHEKKSDGTRQSSNTVAKQSEPPGANKAKENAATEANPVPLPSAPQRANTRNNPGTAPAASATQAGDKRTTVPAGAVGRNSQATQSPNSNAAVTVLAANAPRLPPPVAMKPLPAAIHLPPCRRGDSVGNPLPGTFSCDLARKVSLKDITIVHPDEAFPKNTKLTFDRKDKSLECILTSGPGASAPIARFTVVGEELRFSWLDTVRSEEGTADLLRNCLLSVKVTDSATGAIVQLRQSNTEKAISVSSLARGEPDNSQRVVLDSIPPGKEIGLRLLRSPRNWRIEPAKNEKRHELIYAYDITVSGDEPLHFRCEVMADNTSKHPSRPRDDKRYDRKLRVSVAYVGAGESPYQVIYPTDKEKKCGELQTELNKLKERVKLLGKQSNQGTNSQPKKEGDPIERLKEAISRIRTEIENAEAQKDKKELNSSADQLAGKIVALDRTMKSLAEFQSTNPSLHYSLFIKVADREIELLKTE